MSWLTPWLAGTAAAIAVPSLLILYFLKLRRRNLEVSTTLLWKKSIRDMQANAPFQRLRRNIMLLLQLLILAAALLALGQPILNADQVSAERVVILIDRSASMSTRDELLEGSQDRITRLEKARRTAIELLDSLPTGGMFSMRAPTQAMVVAFDASAEVVQPFTDDHLLLASAIRSIEATDGPTNLDEALRLAGAYMEPIEVEDVGLVRQAGPPLHLFSDGGIADLDRLELPPESRLEFTSVGSAGTPNYSITAIQARRDYDDPSNAEIFIGVQSTDPEPRKLDLQLSIDGLVSGVREISLGGADETGGPAQGSVSFRLPRASRAVIAAEIIQEDALHSDNVARVVLPPAKSLSVGVVSRGNLFLKSALEGMPLARLEMLSEAEFEDLARRGATDEFDVLILDGWVPTSAPRSPDDAPTESSLPPGAFLIFGTAPDLRGLGHDRAAEPEKPDPAVMIDWLREHPALRFVGLDNLIIARPREILATEDVRVIARSSSGPAIIEASQGAVRALVVTFDVSESNWPFDVSFVVFMASAVQYLGELRTALTVDGSTPGETLSTRLPQGAERVRLRTPDGQSVSLHPSGDGRVTYGPVRRAGLYEITWSGESGPTDELVTGRAVRVVPVNLLNPLESRVERREALDLPVGQFRARNSGTDAQRAGRSTRTLWPYLLMAALAILMLEWWIYNRRMAI